MEVLPIKAIREEDGPIIGNNLLSLSKLAQASFPVCDGIVVIPPNFKFQTVLEHFQFKNREIFEQSLHLVKNEIIKIPIPQELEKELTRRKIDSKKVWLNLLDEWLSQIRSKIWREGFSPKLSSSLSAETAFFTKKITASGDAYFDQTQKIAVINITSGKLTPHHVLRLDELTKEADKKLYLPQVYTWILDGFLKIVKIIPFTGEHKKTSEPNNQTIFSQEKPDLYEKSSIKIFLELDNDLKVTKNIDGVLIKGEKISDLDKKILQLIEAAVTFPNSPIIFKLPDISESFGGVRGALKLIHGETILRQESNALLFARHKKGLINVSVAIPLVRSIQEFLQIKRDLAVLGISRKGSLKIWLEMAAPENFLNIEDYLIAGFDGALINLDELAAWLGGFNPEEPESIFYKRQINALIKFLEEGLRILHKAKIPILTSGKLALHDDVLAFLVEKGVWGISVDFSNIVGVHDHLKFVEKRYIRSKMI